MDSELSRYYRLRCKLAKIRRNRRLSYRMKLAAMIAVDCRPGQVWEVRSAVA